MLGTMTQPPLPPSPYPAAVPPPPPSGRWQPERVDTLPGTEFGLIQLRVEPITSGLAIGSLVAGVGAILVTLLVACFGFVGSGGWVTGAFTVLSVVAGVGAVVVGLIARRQIGRSGQAGQVRFTGRGLTIAGICCGAAAAGIAVVILVLTLALQL